MLEIWSADESPSPALRHAKIGKSGNHISGGSNLIPQNLITALKPALKNKNRINIFLDGRFSFSLTLAEFTDAGLKIGQILPESKLSELKSQSDFGKLYQQTLEYVLTRPHSEKEVRDYLKRKQKKRALDQKRYDEFKQHLAEDPEYRAHVKDLRAKTREKNAKLRQKDFTEDNRYEYRGTAKTGLPTKPAAAISDSSIDTVIEKLKTERAIDDASYAKYFIANRHRTKGTSLKKLQLELRAKGISDQLIKEAFSEDEYGESPRDEREELQKVLDKKLRRLPLATTSSEQQANRQKLIQYLLRQGFPYDLVQDALREMDL